MLISLVWMQHWYEDTRTFAKLLLLLLLLLRLEERVPYIRVQSQQFNGIARCRQVEHGICAGACCDRSPSLVQNSKYIDLLLHLCRYDTCYCHYGTGCCLVQPPMQLARNRTLGNVGRARTTSLFVIALAGRLRERSNSRVRL